MLSLCEMKRESPSWPHQGAVKDEGGCRSEQKQRDAGVIYKLDIIFIVRSGHSEEGKVTIHCYRVTVCNNLTVLRRAVRFTGWRFVVDALVGCKHGSYNVVILGGDGPGGVASPGRAKRGAVSRPPLPCYILNNSLTVLTGLLENPRGVRKIQRCMLGIDGGVMMDGS
jgi:hypothetical protein